jgi:hypothetical protein
MAAGGTNALINLASCHDRKHQDPEWAQGRVKAALEALA